MSANGILTEEANAEVEAYFNSKESLVSPEGKLLFSFNNYLNKYIIFNLSKPVRQYTKDRKKEDIQLIS